MPGTRKRQHQSNAPDPRTPVPSSTPAAPDRAKSITRSTSVLLQSSQTPSKRRDRSKLPAVNGTDEPAQPRRQRLQTRQQKAAAGQAVRPATTDCIPKRRAPKRTTRGSVVGSKSSAGSRSGGRRRNQLAYVQSTSSTTASDLPDDVLLLIFQELQLHRCRAAQGACRAPQFDFWRCDHIQMALMM